MGDPYRRYGVSPNQEVMSWVRGGPSSGVLGLATSENINSNTELVDAYQALGDTFKIPEQTTQKIGVKASTPEQQFELESFLGNCYKCQEKGHVKKDCPKLLGNCYKCQEKGHISKNCLKRKRGSSPCGQTLQQQEGTSRVFVVAQKKAKASDLVVEGDITRGFNGLCYKCQEKGHIAKNCPKQTKNIHPRGQTSHQQRDIDGVEASDSDLEGDSVEILKQSLQEIEVRKNTHSNQVEPKSFTGFCYKCRERGHFARNCPEQTTDSHRGQTSLRQQQVTDVVEASKSVEGDTANIREQTLEQIGGVGGAKSFAGFCYKCRERGHSAKYCPQQQTTDSHRGQTSLRQRQVMDVVEDSKSVEGDTLGDTANIREQAREQIGGVSGPKSFVGFCYGCRERGHSAKYCPQQQTTDSHRGQTSLRQQQVTDVVGESKSMEGDTANVRESFSGLCYKCQEKGHIAKNCLKQKNDSQPRGQTSQQQQGTNGVAHKEVEAFDWAVEGSVLRPSFPGYLSSEPSYLTSHHLWSSNDLRACSSNYLQKDPRGYSIDDIMGIGVRPEPGLSGLTAGASIKGPTSYLQDPSLLSQRSDVIVDSPGIPELIKERHDSLRKVDGLPVPARDSNILFIDGLPNDCSRREVGHLFRPFIGFKEIRVIHKEPRRSGDKAMVLCFVEFGDSKCAHTAMDALQGYKFDYKKPDSPVLRIHVAHFPFYLPSDHGKRWFEGP